MAASIKALSEAVAASLSTVSDCRVHAYEPDSFLPPGIVVQQPTIVWDSSNRTFCTREWSFPLAVVVARATDKSAQDELDRIVTAIEERLGEDSTLGGVAEYARLIDARPVTFTSSGVDYPGYTVTLQIVA